MFEMPKSRSHVLHAFFVRMAPPKTGADQMANINHERDKKGDFYRDTPSFLSPFLIQYFAVKQFCHSDHLIIYSCFYFFE